MRRQRNFKIFLIFIVFLYLCRTTAVNRDIDFLKPNDRLADEQALAYTVPSDVTGIGFVRATRRPINYISNTYTFTYIDHRNIILFLLLCLGFKDIITDIRKRIRELNTVKLHGSKYKGGYLLPLL